MEQPTPSTGPDGVKRFKATTAMYDELETNLPRVWMSYSDTPFSPNDALYPPRQVVSKYLEDYAEDVKRLIKFHTQVVDIQLQSSGKDLWSVRTRNLASAEETVKQYDAVAVCSGHYTVPFVPEIPGMEKWNATRPGAIIHSKYFRRAEPYTGLKVLIVGNSMSALDISAHIKAVADPPVLLSQRSEAWFEKTEGARNMFSNIRTVPPIEEFLDPASGRWAVRFADGSFEDGIDRVVYCTGYLFSFPFLKSIGENIITDGMRVHNTYQHMFYIDHPSLAFMMLPMRVQPFPLVEVQAAVLARVWSGRLTLPLKDDMWAWERTTIGSNGDSRNFHTLTHPKDYEYQNSLWDWAARGGKEGRLGSRWDEKAYWYRQRFFLIRLAYLARGADRRKVKTVEELGFDYDVWKREQERMP